MYKCSFSTSECGEFRDTIDCSVRLLDCKDDISYHLQSCHLSKLVGKIQEYELILARAGMFYIPTKKQEEMWVCPKHRYNLGRNWRPLKSCQYPLHSGTKKAHKSKDIVNLEMSKNIQLQFGVTVPVGSGEKTILQTLVITICFALLNVLYELCIIICLKLKETLAVLFDV